MLNHIFRTYNDSTALFCKPYLKRLKGIALINLDNVETGVMEMERCAKVGLAGAQITGYTIEGRQCNMPEYEPAWAAAQDLDMPLSLHLGINRPELDRAWELSSMTAAFQSNSDDWVRMSLTYMIFSGVFERYPKLIARRWRRPRSLSAKPLGSTA